VKDEMAVKPLKTMSDIWQSLQNEGQQISGNPKGKAFLNECGCAK